MGSSRLIDNALDSFIDEMERQPDRNGVKLALKKLTRACGFDEFTYVCNGGTEITGMSSYQPQWQAHYLERNLTLVDPVVRLARQYMRPFCWSRTDPAFQDSATREFFDEAEEFGISSGLTIPIPASYGRFAMLTMVSAECNTAQTVELGNPVRAITAAALVHVWLAKFAAGNENPAKPLLTGRQLACLTWASFGKTTPETAMLLGISPNTARFHLVDAKERLGAVNTSHAVRVAVERGLI
ncbi:MAG TPA: autoinducer binding domain-containing protein [Devosia sp.]|nr:autoinducer binding domain-containing protein [Devosia sp.]